MREEPETLVMAVGHRLTAGGCAGGFGGIMADGCWLAAGDQGAGWVCHGG